MGLLTVFLSITAEGRWQPSIGDPSIVGWVTVLAYFSAAVLSIRAAFSAKRHAVHSSKPVEASPRARERSKEARLLFRFWLAIAWLLCFLGINKQLDLQTLLVQVARDLALSQGWYENRRPYQIAFIVIIGAALVVGSALLAFSLRRVVRRVWLGVVGVCLVASFVLIRAASFHHVDLWLKQGTVQLNWVLELFCIGVLGLAALRERGRVGGGRVSEQRALR